MRMRMSMLRGYIRPHCLIRQLAPLAAWRDNSPLGHLYLYSYAYMCICICVRVFVYARVYACLCVCMRVCGWLLIARQDSEAGLSVRTDGWRGCRVCGWMRIDRYENTASWRVVVRGDRGVESGADRIYLFVGLSTTIASLPLTLPLYHCGPLVKKKPKITADLPTAYIHTEHAL